MPRAKKATAKPETATKTYDEMSAVIRSAKAGTTPVSVSEAKELIGWTEEPDDEDWGKDFDLKDTFGKKVRLINNPSNRPLKRPIADRYASEFLRGVWKLNLESLVFGKSGHIRDGQHRLVGFILAEQQRSINTARWGAAPLTLEILLAFGASDDNETADSYDKGQARTLDDVIYRHEKFGKGVSEKDQRKISRVLSGAIRLVWLRSGGKTVSSAPHFPHSEAMEFYKLHHGILDSCKTVIKLDAGEGSDRLIASLMSLPYAAALHYLMADVNTAKADEFWGLVASGEGLSKGDPILSLRSYLTSLTAGTGKDRDNIVGSVIKAWTLWMEGKTATPKIIKLKQTKNGDGKFVLAEFPRIGGIDSEVDPPEVLGQKAEIILSTLCSCKKEVTYAELSERSGLPRSVLSRICNGENNEDSLENQGLISVAQYEPQDGQKVAPYYLSVTEAGRAKVRK